MVTPDDMARSGVIATLAYCGVQIERGLLSPDAASASLTTVATNCLDASQPTERKERACQYLSREPKALISNAVREGAASEAAAAVSGLKKAPMAGAAARHLDGTGWLLAMLRVPTLAEIRTVAEAAE